MSVSPCANLAPHLKPQTVLFSSVLFAGIMVVARAQAPTSSDLDVIQVRPNFYMIAGAGANIAVQVGPIGAIVVDTGSQPLADKVLAAVKRLTDGSIRYIINTSADADHTGGNERLSKAGKTILGNIGSAGVSEDAYTNGGAASVLAHENVLSRMSAPAGPGPLGPMPPCGRRRPMPAEATRCISTATPSRSCTCPPHIPMATASCSSIAPT